MTGGIGIERDEHAQQFVIIGNAPARDARLSFRARGLHHYLLSLPPGVRVTTESLARDAREGRGAVRTALNELISVGYVKRIKSHDERGRWNTRMVVYETPQPADEGDKPATGTQPGARKPQADFRSLAPPAETPVLAGRTEDRKTDVGFPVAKDLKNKDLKTKENEDRSVRAGEPLQGVVGSSDPMTDMILFEVEERTQTKITPEFAERVAVQILGRAPSKPRDPVKYVRAAIRREEDPRNFLPTGVPDMWDRAMARAVNREQRAGQHTPYQDPADPSVYDLGFDGKPRHPPAACDEAQALKGQLVARMPGESRTDAYTREHLGDPVDLNAQLAAMFGGRYPRGGAADPLTDQQYGPGSTRI